MNVLLNIDKIEEISESIYMTLTVLVANYKIISVWVNHKNITGIINTFEKKPFIAMKPREEIIQQKYNKIIK